MPSTRHSVTVTKKLQMEKPNSNLSDPGMASRASAVALAITRPTRKTKRFILFHVVLEYPTTIGCMVVENIRFTLTQDVQNERYIGID